MAGNFESTLSLQMQSDTKGAKTDLAQLSAEFVTLSKTVQQINVSLVGLTPATQDFLKNLQAVSASAKDSKTAMASMVSVDVSKAFTASQDATKSLETDLSKLAKSAQTSGDSLGAVGTQTQGGVSALDALRGSVVSTSGDMDSFKATMAEMVAAQREQTAAMREMLKSMESVKQGVTALANSGNSWTETVKNWVIIGKFGLDIWDRLTGKSDEAKKAIDENTKAVKEHTKSLKNQGDTIAEQASKLEQLSSAFEATKQSVISAAEAVGAAKDKFDDFAFSVGDKIESGLSKSSKALREFAQTLKETGSVTEAWRKAFGSDSEEVVKETKSFTDRLKQAWDDWVQSFDSEAVKWPTLMKPISEAEKEFLQEHIKTWDNIEDVTSTYSAKFGKEMPENVRRAYLDMRQGIQPEIYDMIEMAAAAGTSLDELAKNIKEKFGADLTGQMGAAFGKMSGEIQGSLSAAASSIKYVIPLQEQLAKAGNADSATKLAIYKQYNADLATQTKAIQDAAKQMVPFTQAQMDEAKEKLNAAKATQEKARAELAAAEASGKSAKETAGLKKAFEDAYNATGDAMKQYDAFGKAISDASEKIKKSIDDAAAAIKKQSDELKTFADSTANTLGISASKMAGYFQTLYAGDSRIKADLPAITAQITAQQQAMNNFRQQVASGAYATADALISAAKQTAESLGGTIEEQRKFMGDALKAIVADQKTIVDAQNKAVQDSVKNMQSAVSAGFAAMKAWYKDYSDAFNVETQRNKTEWSAALTANGNDVRLAQQEFQTYADTINEKSDFMATNMKKDFDRIRSSIQSAIDRNDLQTVDALKKGLADFAQTSVQQFKSLRDQAIATYQSLQAQHATLINAMAQKETEFAKIKEATSEKAFAAVEAIEGRTMSEYELYLRTMDNINATKQESDRLMAQGDDASLAKAKELNDKMISMAQTLKSTKITAYDQMSDSEQAYYHEQVSNLEKIVTRTASEEAQYQNLLAMRQKIVGVITTQEAQQTALNVASWANTKNSELDSKLEQSQLDKMGEQKKVLEDQMHIMADMTTSLNAFMKQAEKQVNFALDTTEAQKKIEAITQARTMQVDFDTNAGKALLDQVLGPRTIPISFEIQDNGAFRIEPIARFSKGGFMPGYGGGDRNLIAVEDGEYIQPKEAVSFWGIQFMEAIRSMKPLHAFRSGGFVAPSYDHVNRALYAATNRVRGFKDGGLVTGSDSSNDILQAIDKLGRAVGDLAESTGGQSDGLQQDIGVLRQAIGSAGQVFSGVAKQISDVAGKLESSMQNEWDVNVNVQADGTGTATMGSWNRRG